MPTRTLGGRELPLLGGSPFASAAPSIVAAIGYLVAALLWVVVGDPLPGGRWLAVHLFTLGVLTNLILAFSEHFGRTLTRHQDQRTTWQTVVVNVGVVLVLVGLPASQRWLTAGGATLVTALVFVAYWRLRRMRKHAVGARFTWIVRIYERAHGAFVHGAILGLLLGLGAFSGAWFASARAAHLHVNVLGWGGLTLLATLVFFGPTIVRTRIEPGADDRAARALRHGATGLTVGVLLLLASGIGGAGGVALRVAAATGLAVFALATTVVCLPVAKAARAAARSATRWPLLALCSWFVLAVWADVVVVATGAWRRLDTLGLLVLLGVLAQAITATLVYLAPMLRGRTFAARQRIIARLQRAAELRAAVFNLGVAAVALASLRLDALQEAAPWLATAGWAAIVAATVQVLVTGLWPLRDAPLVSATATGPAPPATGEPQG